MKIAAHSVLSSLLVTTILSLLVSNSYAASSTPVIVANLQPVDIVDEVEALGTLQANESVDLMPTVTDRVVKINFTDGQRVKRGQLLIEMDAVQERAELLEEQARLDEALKQVERLKPLARQSAATQAELDTQMREVDTAKARMRAIESRIAERSLRAPFDGVVGLRNISVGAIVQPGVMITSIDDDSTMKLDFSIPEVFLAEVSPGLTIEARSRAFKNQIFKGEVVSIDSRIDPVTRSIEVRAVIPNEQGLLKPGMLMRVSLQANPRQGIVIPEESLIASATRSFVFKVIENNGELTVQRVEVKLGTRRKGEAEVLEGLSNGDQIVVHGVNRLANGQAVSIRATEKNNETLQQMLQQGE